jgi:LmbE family N-acetylglucosaminyl deacetylase
VIRESSTPDATDAGPRTELPPEFQGTILLAVPHMDDCVLGSGGLLALLPDKARVHVCYATDGARSPAPLLPWRDRVPQDLVEIRRSEARAALTFLGVPAANIHHLDLPDSRLRHHMAELRHGMDRVIDATRPDCILAPFRYDRHPDHLAVHQAVSRGVEGRDVQIMEYFVYQRWRLLPSGDVRTHIRPQHLVAVRIDAVSGRKRAALDLFRSQTTRFFDWQTRPVLSPQFLDDVSDGAEVFLRYDRSLAGPAIFAPASRWWIRIAHRLEPALKKGKDRLVELVKRGIGG